MLKFPSFIYCLLGTLLLSPIFCFAEGDITCKTVAASISLDPVFKRTLVESVHTDLRTASLINNRLLACLKSDREWFESRGINWSEKAEDECRRRIQSLRDTIARQLPQMRLKLALSEIEFEGDSYPLGYGGIISDEIMEGWGKTPWLFDKLMTRNISHKVGGTSNLKPLTLNEMKAAVHILNESYKKFEEQEQKNPSQNLRSANIQFFSSERKVFEEEYRQILTEFPLVGLLSSPDPNDKEIYQAILVLRQRSDKLLKKHRDKYYLQSAESKFVLNENSLSDKNILPLASYAGSMARLTTSKPEFCSNAVKIQDMNRSSEFWYNMTVAGAMIIGTVGCEVLKARFQVAKLIGQYCTPMVILGLGGAMAIETEIKHSLALEALFQSPYGWTALDEIDYLDDVAFERLLGWLTLPIGSGLPLAKIVSPGFYRNFIMVLSRSKI